MDAVAVCPGCCGCHTGLTPCEKVIGLCQASLRLGLWEVGVVAVGLSLGLRMGVELGGLCCKGW